MRQLDDQARQTLAPAAVEAVGLGVFVDQPLQFARVAREVGADERRRQMAKRDRGEPALGLRRFTRVADDKRIDDRYKSPTTASGKQVTRQSNGFAWQPFQGAVRTHVDDGIDVSDMAEPQPEGKQRMARRQR